jgi:hypothetical protein
MSAFDAVDGYSAAQNAMAVGAPPRRRFPCLRLPMFAPTYNVAVHESGFGPKRTRRSTAAAAAFGAKADVRI